jgi:hypothetical protein
MIFHVDYWNDLGWRDVFSSRAFTQRQKDYDHVLNVDQYTPQIVVNGSDAFVGGNGEQLQKDLNHELSVAPSMGLQVNLKKESGQLRVRYACDGFTSGDMINMALVERGLRTDVTAGENAGRTLHHDNVVKEFVTRPVQDTGEVLIPLRKVHDTAQASIIIFVQNPQTMLIEDAQQLDLEHD